MSDETYNMFLGWSWDRIEAVGMTSDMRWAMWQRAHPVLFAILGAAALVGTAMLRSPLQTR